MIFGKYINRYYLKNAPALLLGLAALLTVDYIQLLIPRLYRLKFRRDIYQDLNALQKAMQQQNEQNPDDQNPAASSLDIVSLELFENIAYIMAKHADPAVPASPDEWLEQFNTFSIYEILPQLIDLWGLNVETQVKSKKNIEKLTAR